MKRLTCCVCFLLVAACLLLPFGISASAEAPKKILTGTGQKLDPFLVRSVEDLCILRDEVNEGKSFEGSFILQTVDLDLSSIENWTPIGNTETNAYFKGTYNGGGHTISNLNCEQKGGDAALFSTLGGVVMNLGIESGNIKGDKAASIAIRSVGKNAVIMNCYNKASIKGTQMAAGIATALANGAVIDCWNSGKIEGKTKAGIVYRADNGNILSCVTYGSVPAVVKNFIGFADLCEQKPASEMDAEALTAQFREATDSYETQKRQMMKNTFAEGSGTERDPYRIRTVKELQRFRTIVNMGGAFADYWIRQEADLDLGGFESWTPIGVYGNGNYFYGVYDGNGHRIWNLNARGTGNNGFFGMLGGQVLNLGIESGRIEGGCVGAITSHGVGSAGMIINCYNKATVIGTVRAGGIADNFSGLVVNCLNLGKVEGQDYTGGVVSYGAKRVIQCYSVGSPVLSPRASVVNRIDNQQMDKAEDAISLLNKGLYDAANYSDYQHNSLNRWNADGTFGAKHNYFLRFILQELALAVLVFAIGLFMWLLWRTSKQSKTFRFGAMKGLLIAERNTLKNSMEARLRTIVAVGFIFGFGMMLVGYLNNDHTITRSFFWPDSKDAFMDFINPMQSVLSNNYATEGHYTNVGGTYPPVARFCFWLAGNILPSETQMLAATSIKADYGTLLTFFFLTLCMVALIGVYRILGGEKRFLFPVLAVFSSPMIFMVDRGNLVILTLLFCAIFVAYYRSENPVLRQIAYICLALAAATKIYPVVLGLLVVKEKKWKPIVACVIYGLAFCILPFFFIGGIRELVLYVRNVTVSFDKNAINVNHWLVNYSSILAGWGENFLGNAAIGRMVAKFTLYPLTVLLAGCALVSREWWKSVLAVMLIIILFPGYSVYYCAAFLAIPLMCFLAAKHTRRIDYAYAALFTLALIPLQFLCGAIGVTQNEFWQFAGSMGVILAFLLIVDCVIDVVGRIKRREPLSALIPSTEEATEAEAVDPEIAVTE